MWMKITTTTVIIKKISIKTRIINTNKIIIKDRITETININKEVKSSNVKIYTATKINFKPRVDSNKTKNVITRSLHSIASKKHTITIIIKRTIRNTATKIGIIIIELSYYIILI